MAVIRVRQSSFRRSDSSEMADDPYLILSSVSFSLIRDVLDLLPEPSTYIARTVLKG